MGRKKIEKAPKKGKQAEKVQSEPEQPQPVEDSESQQPVKEAPKKRGKAAAQSKTQKSTNDIQLFSEAFNSKVDGFKSFYQEFLGLRSSEGEASQQLQKVTQQVRDKIEVATLQVVKEQINEAEKWISQQQQAIKGQISSTQKAEEDIRRSLQAAGTFSDSEIDGQVQGIRSKKTALENSLNLLQEVKNRAQGLYSQSTIDEQ